MAPAGVTVMVFGFWFSGGVVGLDGVLPPHDARAATIAIWHTRAQNRVDIDFIVVECGRAKISSEGSEVREAACE